MQLTSPIPRQHVGKTFVVALLLLGISALAEMTAIAWALASRFHSAPTSAEIANAAPLPQPAPLASNAEKSARSQQQQFTDALTAPAASAAPSAAGAAEETTLASLPKPTPVEQIVPTPESRITALIEQARALRERGDTSTAITRLREALAISPSNALALSELAVTFEKMGLTDKALEQWRHIYDLGESAGIYYQAADAKLKNNDLSSHAASSTGDAAKESTGLQPGSVLGLVNLSTVERPDSAEGQKKFTLKVPIRARQGATIDVNEVVIQVFFYDQLDDGSIVQTNANVSSHWSTLPADWKDDDIEILEVNYSQPKPDAAKTNENRRYYGYVVRIYYKKELQDVRAEPIALLKKYPPPLMLQAGDTAQ